MRNGLNVGSLSWNQLVLLCHFSWRGFAMPLLKFHQHLFWCITWWWFHSSYFWYWIHHLPPQFTVEIPKRLVFPPLQHGTICWSLLASHQLTKDHIEDTLILVLTWWLHLCNFGTCGPTYHTCNKSPRTTHTWCSPLLLPFRICPLEPLHKRYFDIHLDSQSEKAMLLHNFFQLHS